MKTGAARIYATVQPRRHLEDSKGNEMRFCFYFIVLVGPTLTQFCFIHVAAAFRRGNAYLAYSLGPREEMSCPTHLSSSSSSPSVGSGHVVSSVDWR